MLRWARNHAPFVAVDVAGWLGLGVAVVNSVLRRLVAEARLVEGDLRPPGGALQYCRPGVLRVLRRRSLAALRNAVEPVPPQQFARFLTHWQGIARPLSGTEGLSAVQQLAGYPVPASSLESLVLPARVRVHPRDVGRALAAGEIVWQGNGALAGTDAGSTPAPGRVGRPDAAQPSEPPTNWGARCCRRWPVVGVTCSGRCRSVSASVTPS